MDTNSGRSTERQTLYQRAEGRAQSAAQWKRTLLRAATDLNLTEPERLYLFTIDAHRECEERAETDMRLEAIQRQIDKHHALGNRDSESRAMDRFLSRHEAILKACLIQAGLDREARLLALDPALFRDIRSAGANSLLEPCGPAEFLHLEVAR